MEAPALLESTAALLPHVAVLFTGLIVLVLDLYLPPRGRWATEAVSLVGLAVAFACVLCQAGGEPRAVFMGMAVVDGLGTFFNAAFVLIAALTVLLSAPYVRREDIRPGEYYALVLFATLGFMFVGSASDLVMMFLAIETFSMATYILAGLLRDTPRSLEAAFKYFMLGAFSSAFFLYGIATVYGTVGTTNLLALSQALSEQGTSPLLLMGMGLLIVGLGFKVAVVPFHMWAPDVYEGAPTAVTAFMTAGPKAAAFAALLRVFAQGFGAPVFSAEWVPIFAVLAALTMLLGNIVAVVQQSVKRMLAYSSIAHAGYALVALAGAQCRRGRQHPLLPDRLCVHVAGRLHGSDSRRPARRPAARIQRLRRPGRHEPGPGGHHVAVHVCPGRLPAHRRVYGQILRVQRCGAVGILRPGGHRRAYQRHFGGVLRARRDSHVHARARCRGGAPAPGAGLHGMPWRNRYRRAVSGDFSGRRDAAGGALGGLSVFRLEPAD